MEKTTSQEGAEGNEYSTSGITERVRQEPAVHQHGGDHDSHEGNVPGRGSDCHEVELEEELGRERCQRAEASETTPNYRNGYSRKTVKTQLVEVDIKVPRDRKGSFDTNPQLKMDRHSVRADIIRPHNTSGSSVRTGG